VGPDKTFQTVGDLQFSFKRSLQLLIRAPIAYLLLTDEVAIGFVGGRGLMVGNYIFNLTGFHRRYCCNLRTNYASTELIEL
jgi:hypothetical protein